MKQILNDRPIKIILYYYTSDELPSFSVCSDTPTHSDVNPYALPYAIYRLPYALMHIKTDEITQYFICVIKFYIKFIELDVYS